MYQNIYCLQFREHVAPSLQWEIETLNKRKGATIQGSETKQRLVPHLPGSQAGSVFRFCLQNSNPWCALCDMVMYSCPPCFSSTDYL